MPCLIYFTEREDIHPALTEVRIRLVVPGFLYNIPLPIVILSPKCWDSIVFHKVNNTYTAGISVTAQSARWSHVPVLRDKCICMMLVISSVAFCSVVFCSVVTLVVPNSVDKNYFIYGIDLQPSSSKISSSMHATFFLYRGKDIPTHYGWETCSDTADLSRKIQEGN